MSITLTACADASRGSRETIPSGSQEEGLLIGVSMPTTQLAYRKAMKDLILESADIWQSEGVQFLILDADGSQEQQNQDILHLVDSGADGIVLVPGTMEGCLSAIGYANQKGVPVITVDNRVLQTDSAQVIGFVGSDHEAMGQMAADLFLDLLEEQKAGKEPWNVIHMTGIPDSSGAIDRGRSITNSLSADGRIRLLGAYDGEFTVKNAKSVMEDCLAVYDSIDGVICQNDNMAEGCCEALEEAGLAGEVIVVGIDGQESTLELIEKGKIQGTVLQSPSMILDGVQALCDYLDGKPIESLIFTPTYPVDQTNVIGWTGSGTPAAQRSQREERKKLP